MIPALVTIVLTFKTKKIVPALLFGVIIGGMLSTRSLFDGVTSIGTYIVNVLTDEESAYTLGFLVAFGALAELIEMAGGISGFSAKIEKWIKTERSAWLWTWILTLFTFFDSSFHTIAVGTIMEPLVTKVKAAKEKFAFLLSVSSLQLILLIPVATAYIGYMVTLVTNNLRNAEITLNPYVVVVKSLYWNFFSITMIVIAIGVSIWGLGFGRYKLGKADDEEGLTQAHIEKEEQANKAVEEYPRRSRNLLIPVFILITTTLFFFWWTGRTEETTVFEAFSQAKFSISIFAGAILTIFITIIYFLAQKISLAEIEAHLLIGAEKVFSLVIILVLSWALTEVTQDLGFNDLIEGFLGKGIPQYLIPAIVFLIAAVVSYTLGSSWATWALIMPLAVSFAVRSDINLPLIIGTVWAGGAVADVISPLSAQMAGISFGKHLSTSFPFVIVGVLISFIAYLAVGFITT